MAYTKQDSGTAPPPGFAVGSSYPGDPYTTNAYTNFGAGAQYPNNSYGETSRPNADQMFFSDKSIRRAFIRKVYSILMCQLAISCAFIAFFVYNDAAKRFAQRNPSLLLIAFVVTIVCLLVMACFENARRTAPQNYIFLFTFTLAESFMLGVICTVYRAEEVLLAVGICTVICFGLTIFAFQTKIDFTLMGGILFVCVLVLFIFGIVLMFWKSNTARLVYSCFGALLFSIYLVYDTQLMMGGDHKYSISPEEYVFAALNLYLDIVNIFLYILSILGSSRD